MDFDAIVVGSGISGGWVAKELCERGLKTLVIERGRHVNHRTDYLDFVDALGSAESRHGAGGRSGRALRRPEPVLRLQLRHQAMVGARQRASVFDARGSPYHWIRGYHLGGRSITWGRQTYRMSDFDFNANQQDGHGIDWPIRYADLSPWYDRVERFAGISGANEGLEQLPDGQFLPPMDLNCVEVAFKKKHRAANFPTRRITVGRCAHLTEPTAEHIALGRGPCQLRSICERGCGYGAYFSSLSATLPAAQKTGNLTVVTDAIVERLDYDHAKRRVSGVRVIDANTRQGRSYQARVVFLCASTIGTAQILLGFAVGVFSERPREPLGRGRPLSHGPRDGHRRRRARIRDSSIATTTAGGRPASTCRATSTSPKTRTSISCAASASRVIRARSSWDARRARSGRRRRAQAAAAHAGTLGNAARSVSAKCCRARTTA